MAVGKILATSVTNTPAGGIAATDVQAAIDELDTEKAAAANGVTNGDSHDHSGGDGAQIDHGGLGGLTDDDHARYFDKDGSKAMTGNADFGGYQMTNGIIENGSTVPTTNLFSGRPFVHTPTGRVVNMLYSAASQDTGTTTSTTANKLVDSGGLFTTAPIVKAGMWVKNTTDTTWAQITAVDSATTLSLSADIMVSGEAYDIQTGWIPIISLGSMTVYVDNTDGTDAIDKGGAVDGSAVKTIQYAVDLIPGLVGGNVTIEVNGEAYVGDVRVQGKNFTGSYDINFNGQPASAATTGTVETYTSDADTFYIDDTSEAWTVNGYIGYYVEMTSGSASGERLLIESNTATRLRVVQKFAAAIVDTTDTYKIFIPATDIQGLVYIAPGQTNVIFNSLTITGRVQAANPGSAVRFYWCRIIKAGVDVVTWRHNGQGFIYRTYIYTTAAYNILLGYPGARLDSQGSWIRGGTINPLNTNSSGSHFLNLGTVVSDGGSHGVELSAASSGGFTSAAVGTRARILNNGGWGVYVHGASSQTSNTTSYFSGNSSGTYTGVAASYGSAT